MPSALAVLALALLAAEPSAPRVVGACPTLAAPNVAAVRAKLTTLYKGGDGFSMHRAGGPSWCAGYAATRRCVVQDPGLMEVTFAGATTYFDIPLGREVVLDVHEGKVRCGLAG
jgi:hypothetical protein